MDEQTNPNEFVLPEDLTTLTPDELAQVVTDAQAEVDTLRGIDAADMTDAQADRLDYLADAVEAVGAEETRRETAASEREARREAAIARLDGPDDEDGTTPVEGDPAADDDAADDDADEGDDGTVVPEAVAAGGTPRTRIAARKPRVPARQTAPAYSLIAGADVGGGVQAGGRMADLSAVAAAFINRSKAFPQGQGREANVRHQFGVATIERDFAQTTDGLVDTNQDFRDVQSLLREAGRENRLSGGSLVAAGGWCAPSETMYGMLANETLDGILDLPEVGITRGGVRFTPGPDFSDIYTSAGFAQTETEAIAGTTKACVEVDCPDFSEVRLDAVGICVKAPLLTNSAYPELVRRWIEGTVVANAHKIAARLVTSMRTALGTALAPTLTLTPITWSTLTAMELVIEGQRQAYRLSESESLEVKVPRWVRVAIRADLANRMGIGKESVSNADIAQHFADRGAAVQFILGYLELATPKTVIAFPTTFEIMVYPAGTFVRGTASVISLDTVYDTADLQTNVYTAAFVEDGVLLAKMGNGGARITIPVNVSGMLGAAQLDDTWGGVQAESLGT